MDITKQNHDNGVVPVFVRSQWRRWVYAESQWHAAKPIAASLGYKLLWAMYRGVQDNGDPYVVEGRLLLSNRIHDFCGGLQVSSGRVMLQGRPANYTEMGYWGCVPEFSEESCFNTATWDKLDNHDVPCIDDWFADPVPYRRAPAIMQRSLIGAALSLAMRDYKGILLGYDRISNDNAFCKTRGIMQSALDLRYCLSPSTRLSFAPMWVYYDGEPLAAEMCRLAPSSGHPDYDEDLDDVDISFVAAYHADGINNLSYNETPTFTNPNSQRKVGVLTLTFDRGAPPFAPCATSREDKQNPYFLSQTHPAFDPPATIMTAAKSLKYCRLAPQWPFANG